jgi:SAM-dependent methyltransferase
MTKNCAREMNLMADREEICPVLNSHYNLSPEKKERFLETPEAKFLLESIPERIKNILVLGFLKGLFASEIPGFQDVINYFQKNSLIIPALTENPGTYTMLEKMYHFERVGYPIDQYFAMSMAGGQALKNRYDVVNNYAIHHINEVLRSNEKCLMLDIGSGPGRNGVDICLRNHLFRDRLKIDCIDIDKDAIALGEALIKRYGLKNISFVKKSMTALNGHYPGTVDYAILIGVLCGLTFPERVGLLGKLKPYFKKGGRLIGASLLEEMAIQDLLCAYVLRETTGWGLQYPPVGELKKAFEAAGWHYVGYFQDTPTNFYEIGIGIVQ